MEALDKVTAFIENLETKTFYTYLGIILGGVLLLAGGILFRYYRNATALDEKITLVNEEREKVQEVLTKLASVQKQRESVDRLLDDKVPFYLLEYFQKLTNQLGIRNVKHDRTPKDTQL